MFWCCISSVHATQDLYETKSGSAAAPRQIFTLAHQASKMAATFVTIPASNYVEKARWALQLAGVAFSERKYAPLFAYLSTMPNGGKSVPLLVVPGKDGEKSVVLKDSSDILDYCATELSDLYPTLKTKELELYYDKVLGPHARRCGKLVDGWVHV